MTRPRRQQKRPEKSRKIPWRATNDCPGCGKKCFDTKHDAKTAAKVKHPDDNMSPYRCRSKNPLVPQPAPWHYGHLDEMIKEGLLPRSALYDRSEAFVSAALCEHTGCLITQRHHNGPHLTKNRKGDWILLEPVENNDNDNDNEENTPSGSH